MTAFAFDFVLVSILALLLWTGLFVVTLGMSALILPPLWPFVAFFYNGFSVSGSNRATPGMRLFDLEMRAGDGSPVTFIAAGVHAILLYVSWLFPPVFLASLFTPDKRCLHDIFAGVVVVRRPD
jgi:Predicted membrane protein/domain